MDILDRRGEGTIIRGDSLARYPLGGRQLALRTVWEKGGIV